MNKIIKTSELSGRALNWAVAKCEEQRGVKFGTGFSGEMLLLDEHEFGHRLAYSTDWAQGGNIIEREKICTCPTGKPSGSLWSATDDAGRFTAFGPTPLIAAMRCYCCVKLGNEVEIPEELL